MKSVHYNKTSSAFGLYRALSVVLGERKNVTDEDREYQRLYEAYNAVTESDESTDADVIRAQMHLAAALVRRNYDLSDADLKLAAQAAFQRNVWSPLAKATLLEVWRRWSFMVTIRDAQSDPALPPYPRPLRQSAFGPVPADGEERP